MDAKTLRNASETHALWSRLDTKIDLITAMELAFDGVSAHLTTDSQGECALKDDAPERVVNLFRAIEDVQHNFPDLFEA